MKIDCIPDYEVNLEDCVIRAMSFSNDDLVAFCRLLKERVIAQNEIVRLTDEAFVEASNCDVVLKMSDISRGIVKTEEQSFDIILNRSDYERALELLSCYIADSGIFVWLFESDAPTVSSDHSFLVSVNGMW